MPYDRPPTKEELDQFRQGIVANLPAIRLFLKDIDMLLWAAQSAPDDVFYENFKVLLDKFKLFEAMTTEDILKKGMGDAKPPIQRGPGKVVRGGCRCNGGQSWCVRCYNT